MKWAGRRRRIVFNQIKHNTEGPFTQDRDRWATIERSKIGLISQWSFKSNNKIISVEDPCVLVDLSAISPSWWKYLRSLKDHWEIIGRSMRLLNAPWALVEPSLNVCWVFIEKSLPLPIIQRLFRTESKLWGDHGDRGDHWMIIDKSFIERSWWSLGDRWALFERTLRDLAIFFIAQPSLNDRHPCVKGGLTLWLMLEINNNAQAVSKRH